MKYSLISFIAFLISMAHHSTLCMQKYASESDIRNGALDKKKSGSDSSIDSIDPTAFIEKVRASSNETLAEEPPNILRGIFSRSKKPEIPETIAEEKSTDVKQPSRKMFAGRSKSVPCVLKIDTSPLAQGDDLQEKPGIHIVFQEFPEPQTPTGNTFKLFGVPLKLTHADHSTSIIFMPQGGAFTPTKNSIDFGDKTGDRTYDELKKRLPKDQSTALALLTALLANRVKSYLASKKESAPTACNLDSIYALAERYKQKRIAEIISDVRNLTNYDPVKCELYDLELCRMQKQAEKILRDAGLQLLK